MIKVYISNRVIKACLILGLYYALYYNINILFNFIGLILAKNLTSLLIKIEEAKLEIKVEFIVYSCLQATDKEYRFQS